MREAGAGTVLVSLDREGMLLAAEEGTWYAPPLAIPVKNPAGAGDGAVAGLCHALLRGAPPPEQLESAVRVASAVCLTPGTAEFHVADLASLPPVRVTSARRVIADLRSISVSAIRTSSVSCDFSRSASVPSRSTSCTDTPDD